MKRIILTGILLTLSMGSILFITSESNAERKKYNIGDSGPAGGFIFYINPTPGDEGWTYLEAAPEDIGVATWGCVGKSIPGTTEMIGIGFGRANTIAILGNCRMTLSKNAAQMAAGYNGGGKTDWFLPSAGELEKMLFNLKAEKYGFVENRYWSSTQHNRDDAVSVDFLKETNNHGSNSVTAKYDHARVRAIRFF